MQLSRARMRLLGRLRRRATRQREGAYVAEGIRCVSEVLAAGADIRFVVTGPRLADIPGGNELRARLAAAEVETAAVDEATFGELAHTDTPQGVLAVCNQPEVTLESPNRLLVADAIQDPGNLGTLIRTAWALGIDALVALDGTVDPYNAKVVRASAGTVARLPIVGEPWADLAPRLASLDLPLVVAAAGAPSAAPRSRFALAIGNEGRGVRDEVRDAATESVAIPMTRTVDSLNAAVAGSILMYALTTGSGDVA